mmetsp:Transcript_3845/g.10905  ORF Transcript_3845/g.10905 Transcript_3845/m.10905 type:complete len:325 (+) Transcript_3845:184-1158(+)
MLRVLRARLAPRLLPAAMEVPWSSLQGNPHGAAGMQIAQTAAVCESWGRAGLSSGSPMFCQGTASSAGCARGYATGSPSPTKLADIVNLGKFQALTSEQCSEMWMEFHTNDSKGQAAAVLSAADYERFHSRASERLVCQDGLRTQCHSALSIRVPATNTLPPISMLPGRGSSRLLDALTHPHSPLFVLPVMKPGGGYFNLLLQSQMPFVLFTSLEEFRSMGTAAPSHLHITHYTELKDDKDVVFVRADVTSNSGDVTIKEARTLMALLHSYYLDPRGYLKVHTFNHTPDSFDFDELLGEIQAVDRTLSAAAHSGASESSTDQPK